MIYCRRLERTLPPFGAAAGSIVDQDSGCPDLGILRVRTLPASARIGGLGRCVDRRASPRYRCAGPGGDAARTGIARRPASMAPRPRFLKISDAAGDASPTASGCDAQLSRTGAARLVWGRRWMA